MAPAKKNRKTQPATILVGRYVMYDALIHVYANTKANLHYGATTTFAWTPGGYVTMNINVQNPWHDVIKSTIHEVMEVAFMLGGLEFEPARSLRGRSTDRFHFMMSHEEFGFACDNAGDMLTYMIPRLNEIWSQEYHGNKPKAKSKAAARALSV